jgi:hypothetical protein
VTLRVEVAGFVGSPGTAFGTSEEMRVSDTGWVGEEKLQLAKPAQATAAARSPLVVLCTGRESTPAPVAEGFSNR